MLKIWLKFWRVQFQWCWASASEGLSMAEKMVAPAVRYAAISTAKRTNLPLSSLKCDKQQQQPWDLLIDIIRISAPQRWETATNTTLEKLTWGCCVQLNTPRGKLGTKVSGRVSSLCHESWFAMPDASAEFQWPVLCRDPSRQPRNTGFLTVTVGGLLSLPATTEPRGVGTICLYNMLLISSPRYRHISIFFVFQPFSKLRPNGFSFLCHLIPCGGKERCLFDFSSAKVWETRRPTESGVLFCLKDFCWSQSSLCKGQASLTISSACIYPFS